MLPSVKDCIESDRLDLEMHFAVCAAEWQLVEAGKIPEENKKHCKFRYCPYCYFKIGPISYPYNPSYKHLRDLALKDQNK